MLDSCVSAGCCVFVPPMQPLVVVLETKELVQSLRAYRVQVLRYTDWLEVDERVVEACRKIVERARWEEDHSHRQALMEAEERRAANDEAPKRMRAEATEASDDNEKIVSGRGHTEVAQDSVVAEYEMLPSSKAWTLVV